MSAGNPENNLSGEGWSIFNSILGWTSEQGSSPTGSHGRAD